jgi:deoxyribose-phosphate aldolase
MEKWDEKLAAMIDHTILRSNTTDEDVKRLCDEACKYRFASAVVQPHYVPLASRSPFRLELMPPGTRHWKGRIS